MKKVDRKLFVWISFLAFLAGGLNSYTILKFSLTASHVTGNLTKVSMDIAKNDFQNFLTLGGLILSFFVGSVVAGMIIGIGRDFELRKRYGDTFIFIGIFLKFIEVFLYNNVLFIFFIAFALGLQNGLFIRYKGMVIRTTHMTGTVTDLGVVIGHYLQGNHETKWKIKHYFSNIFSFVLGGFITTLLYDSLGRYIFNFISLAYIFNGIYYFRLRHRYYRLTK